MKTKIIFLFFLALLFQTNSVEAQKRRSVPKPKTLTARQIADKTLPSVVLIITQDENGNPMNQGSGFVYKPGLVVSNLHVFERATNAIVKNVKTGEISKAVEVVAMNARQDICVIRISNTKFPVLPLGDSHAVRTGDDIYVASNPKGLEGSFTKGIVSSVRESERSNKGDDEIITWAKNFTDQTDRTLFQIDAAISRGSSGGAVVNTNGEVVGIVRSSLKSGQNLNFAIPVDQLLSLEHKFQHTIQLAGACAYKDIAREKLIGRVRILRKKWFPRSNGIIYSDREPITTSQTISDMDGNILEDTTFQATDGKFLTKTNYSYDENRLQTSMTRVELNGEPRNLQIESKRSVVYKLNERRFSGTYGQMSESGGMMAFDANGNRVKWYLDGVVIESTYDSRGREISASQKRNGRVEIYSEFSYEDDENGNWIIQMKRNRYPNTESVDPNRWFKGDPEFREIEYFD